MNKTPSTGLSHPLVAAYLSDLEQALQFADQQERIDTIAAVREHLTDALGEDDADAGPTTEQVRAVLDELGSVEQIAASATPASAPPTPPASTLQGDRKPEGSWAAPALLAVAIVSLVLPLYGAVLAIGCLVTAVVLLRSGAPRRNFLQATMAVSIVSLVVTLLLVVFSLAFFNASGGTASVSGGPVPAVASYAPAPSQG
jgi:thiol:disulfide interchange protein